MATTIYCDDNLPFDGGYVANFVIDTTPSGLATNDYEIESFELIDSEGEEVPGRVSIRLYDAIHDYIEEKYDEVMDRVCGV